MTREELDLCAQEDPRSPEWHTFASELADLRRAQVRVAVRLARWTVDGRVFDTLVGSLSEFGRRHGLGPAQVHGLVAAGMLLQDRPDLEPLLLDGRLDLESADLLHRILSCDGAVRPGEDWVDKAVLDDTSSFRRRVEKRLAEIAAGGPVRHVGMYVSAETARRFGRARTLASRRAGRSLTRPEAFGEVVTDYLRRHDPLWKPAPRRRRVTRVSDTVPEAEKRAVRLRFGDRCALEGCTNEAHLELAHVRARALGGANTAANLLELCSRHHRMFDAGRILLRRDVAGHESFVDRDGRFVARMRQAPSRPPP